MENDVFNQYIAETYRDDFVSEIIDDDIDNKIKQLAGFIKAAKYAIFYTGAGISVSAGIPDYRSPDGLWTKRKNNDDSWKQLQNIIYNDNILPSINHHLMTKFVSKHLIKSVLTTNIDGLHVDAGLDSRSNLIEMHGNKYVEECRKCSFEIYNSKTVSNINDRNHQTGNKCPICQSELYNNIVLFGDTYIEVPSYEKTYDRAFIEVCRADLIVVWGSSLLVPSACDLVDYVVERGGKLVIINKQRTPKDPLASLIINNKCEIVIEKLYQYFG